LKSWKVPWKSYEMPRFGEESCLAAIPSLPTQFVAGINLVTIAEGCFEAFNFITTLPLHRHWILTRVYDTVRPYSTERHHSSTTADASPTSKPGPKESVIGECGQGGCHKIDRFRSASSRIGGFYAKVVN
jgi:hypothetical protein